MKKIFTALGWLVLLASLGAAAMTGLAIALVHHHLPWRGLGPIALTGAVPGALGWGIALVFASLPGTRRTDGALPRFGLVQAIWGMAGTLLMMLCGAILPYSAAVYVMLVRILRRLPSHLPDWRDPTLLLTSLLASEIFAALWLVWYLRRQGPRVVADGSAAGIAWCAATPRAYAMAGLCALITLALAGAEFRLVPPDLSKLNDMELAQLFEGPPLVAILATCVVVFLAPVIEELLFRGLAFAGIAARLGPVWAVTLTTLIFTALHAPEKIHYLPGFADVAAVALLSCFLRLRYRSIRPGIVLHFLYNFGMLIIPTLTGGS